MKAVTFGEIMLRLKTPEYLRIVQDRILKQVMAGRRQSGSQDLPC